MSQQIDLGKALADWFLWGSSFPSLFPTGYPAEAAACTPDPARSPAVWSLSPFPAFFGSPLWRYISTTVVVAQMAGRWRKPKSAGRKLLLGAFLRFRHRSIGHFYDHCLIMASPANGYLGLKPDRWIDTRFNDSSNFSSYI